MKVKTLLTKIEKKRVHSDKDMLLLANAMYDLAEELGYGLEVRCGKTQCIDMSYYPHIDESFAIRNRIAKDGAWEIEGSRTKVLK